MAAAGWFWRGAASHVVRRVRVRLQHDVLGLAAGGGIIPARPRRFLRRTATKMHRAVHRRLFNAPLHISAEKRSLRTHRGRCAGGCGARGKLGRRTATRVGRIGGDDEADLSDGSDSLIAAPRFVSLTGKRLFFTRGGGLSPNAS
jgi:hypothetical protein